MKKYIIIPLLTIVVLLTSCQATPKENTIQSKNKDLVQEVIDASQEENKKELQEDKEVIKQQIEKVNRHLDLSIDTANPLTKIVVNADIDIPKYERIPLLRLKPKNISKEQFERFAYHIAGDEPLYCFPHQNRLYYSKEEIEDTLPLMKSWLKKDMKPQDREHLKSLIEMMERGYESALYREEEEVYNGELVPYYDFGTRTILKAYLGNTIAAIFTLRQLDSGIGSYVQYSGREYYLSYIPEKPYEDGMEHRAKISYEEALNLAEEAVRTLEGEESDFALSGSFLCTAYNDGYRGFTEDDAPQCFSFHFIKQYNGLNVNIVEGLLGSSEDPVRECIHAEQLNIKVNEKGLCWLEWSDPSEPLYNITEDVPLISFDEVLDIFQKQCRYQFTWSPKGDEKRESLGCTIDVHRVEMNLMVTAEKDNLETYLLIPVWDFIGDVHYDRKIIGEDGCEYEGQKNVSILTINAIDGTIINREKGY